MYAQTLDNSKRVILKKPELHIKAQSLGCDWVTSKQVTSLKLNKQDCFEQSESEAFKHYFSGSFGVWWYRVMFNLKKKAVSVKVSFLSNRPICG
jgi:hypothetical protein